MGVPNTIPVLHKSVKLLEALAASGSGAATLAELSQSQGIPTTTCYRILKTFEHHEWLRQQDDGSFAFSSGMLPLLRGIDGWKSILEKMKPELQNAADQCGLTVKFSIRKMDKQISLVQAVPPLSMAVTSRVDVPFPVVEGASGAVLLSQDEEDAVIELHSRAEEDTREIFPLDNLLTMYRECCKKGFCKNLHPGRWGIYSVSVPVVQESGQIAGALTAFGSRQMLDAAGVDNCRQCLQELADKFKRLFSGIDFS